MTNLAGLPPLGQKRGKPKPNPKRIARVKEMPCIVCGRPGPSDAHHCICGRYSQAKASDDETIPLCKYCHQWGADAIHEDKAGWIERNGEDFRYLPTVDKILAREEDESLGDWF